MNKNSAFSLLKYNEHWILINMNQRWIFISIIGTAYNTFWDIIRTIIIMNGNILNLIIKIGDNYFLMISIVISVFLGWSLYISWWNIDKDIALYNKETKMKKEIFKKDNSIIFYKTHLLISTLFIL